MQLPIIVKIINNDGKVTEIRHPFSLVAVADRVTISYPEGEHPSWTQTTTFFIATMEIIPDQIGLVQDKNKEDKQP